MGNFGLNDRQTEIITDILAKYPEVEQAVIYGSRAKGNYRAGSDIDLTLKGQNLTPQILLQISNDLYFSTSPYLFDLSIYHRLTNPVFIEQIDKTGKIFYQRNITP